MSTAADHAVEFDVNETISRNILTLIAARAMHPVDFYEALELSKGTYYNKRRGDSPWTAAEVQRAADVLGVDVATLYRGDLLPHLDSNQKPADLHDVPPATLVGDVLPFQRLARPRAPADDYAALVAA